MSIHQITTVLKSETSLLLKEELWQIEKPVIDRFYAMGSPSALRLLEALPDNGLAIVGTRDPQPRSIHQVGSVIRDLRDSRTIIISGLARGIDTSAHIAALDNNIPTVAVLGSALDQIYPKENISLVGRILEGGGLILSEFPPGTQPIASNFIRRNRLIAIWSKATWIVEAPYKSGALNTAKWARDNNRYCFSTPCYPGDSHLSGNQTLIDKHHAEPFWGVHSLGKAWLHLATKNLKSTNHNHKNVTKLSDEELLAFDVAESTTTEGAARVESLLDNATNRGWSPGRFFVALRRAIDKKLLLDKNGLLLKNSG